MRKSFRYRHNDPTGIQESEGKEAEYVQDSRDSWMPSVTGMHSGISRIVICRNILCSLYLIHFFNLLPTLALSVSHFSQIFSTTLPASLLASNLPSLIQRSDTWNAAVWSDRARGASRGACQESGFGSLKSPKSVTKYWAVHVHPTHPTRRYSEYKAEHTPCPTTAFYNQIVVIEICSAAVVEIARIRFYFKSKDLILTSSTNSTTGSDTTRDAITIPAFIWWCKDQICDTCGLASHIGEVHNSAADLIVSSLIYVPYNWNPYFIYELVRSRGAEVLMSVTWQWFCSTVSIRLGTLLGSPIAARRHRSCVTNTIWTFSNIIRCRIVLYRVGLCLCVGGRVYSSSSPSLTGLNATPVGVSLTVVSPVPSSPSPL